MAHMLDDAVLHVLAIYYNIFNATLAVIELSFVAIIAVYQFSGRVEGKRVATKWQLQVNATSSLKTAK